MIKKEANISLLLGLFSLFLPIFGIIHKVNKLTDAINGRSAIIAHVLEITLELVAISFGWIALKKIKKDPDKYTGGGRAKLGIILASLPMLIIILDLL
jgi:hypothetical protein